MDANNVSNDNNDNNVSNDNNDKWLENVKRLVENCCRDRKKITKIKKCRIRIGSKCNLKRNSKKHQRLEELQKDAHRRLKELRQIHDNTIDRYGEVIGIKKPEEIIRLENQLNIDRQSRKDVYNNEVHERTQTYNMELVKLEEQQRLRDQDSRKIIDIERRLHEDQLNDHHIIHEYDIANLYNNEQDRIASVLEKERRLNEEFLRQQNANARQVHNANDQLFDAQDDLVRQMLNIRDDLDDNARKGHAEDTERLRQQRQERELDRMNANNMYQDQMNNIHKQMSDMDRIRELSEQERQQALQDLRDESIKSIKQLDDERKRVSEELKQTELRALALQAQKLKLDKTPKSSTADQLEFLRRQLQILEKQLIGAAADPPKSETAKTELSGRISEIKGALTSQKPDTVQKVFDSEKSVLESSLVNLKDASTKLQDSINKLTQEKDATKSKFKETVKTLDQQIKNQQELYNSERNKLQQDLLALQTKHDESIAKIEQEQQQFLKDLKLKAEELRDGLSEEQKKTLESSDAKIAEIAKSIETLKTDGNQLTQDHAEQLEALEKKSVEDLATYKATVDDLQKDLTKTINDANQAHGENIKTLKTNIDELTQMMNVNHAAEKKTLEEGHQNILKSLGDKHDEDQANLKKDHDDKHAKLIEKINALKPAAPELSEDELEKVRNPIIAKMNEHKTELLTTQEELRNLLADVPNKEQLDELKRTVNEMKKAQEQYNGVQAQLDEALNTIHALAAEQEQVNTEKSQLINDKKQLDLERDALATEQKARDAKKSSSDDKDDSQIAELGKVTVFGNDGPIELSMDEPETTTKDCCDDIQKIDDRLENIEKSLEQLKSLFNQFVGQPDIQPMKDVPEISMSENTLIVCPSQLKSGNVIHLIHSLLLKPAFRYQNISWLTYNAADENIVYSENDKTVAFKTGEVFEIKTFYNNIVVLNHEFSLGDLGTKEWLKLYMDQSLNHDKGSQIILYYDIKNTNDNIFDDMINVYKDFWYFCKPDLNNNRVCRWTNHDSDQYEDGEKFVDSEESNFEDDDEFVDPDENDVVAFADFKKGDDPEIQSLLNDVDNGKITLDELDKSSIKSKLGLANLMFSPLVKIWNNISSSQIVTMEFDSVLGAMTHERLMTLLGQVAYLVSQSFGVALIAACPILEPYKYYILLTTSLLAPLITQGIFQTKNKRLYITSSAISILLWNVAIYSLMDYSTATGAAVSVGIAGLGYMSKETLQSIISPRVNKIVQGIVVGGFIQALVSNSPMILEKLWPAMPENVKLAIPFAVSGVSLVLSARNMKAAYNDARSKNWLSPPPESTSRIKFMMYLANIVTLFFTFVGLVLVTVFPPAKNYFNAVVTETLNPHMENFVSKLPLGDNCKTSAPPKPMSLEMTSSNKSAAESNTNNPQEDSQEIVQASGSASRNPYEAPNINPNVEIKLKEGDNKVFVDTLAFDNQDKDNLKITLSQENPFISSISDTQKDANNRTFVMINVKDGAAALMRKLAENNDPSGQLNITATDTDILSSQGLVSYKIVANTPDMPIATETSSNEDITETPLNVNGSIGKHVGSDGDTSGNNITDTKSLSPSQSKSTALAIITNQTEPAVNSTGTCPVPPYNGTVSQHNKSVQLALGYSDKLPVQKFYFVNAFSPEQLERFNETLTYESKVLYESLTSDESGAIAKILPPGKTYPLIDIGVWKGPASDPLQLPNTCIRRQLDGHVLCLVNDTIDNDGISFILQDGYKFTGEFVNFIRNRKCEVDDQELSLWDKLRNFIGEYIYIGFFDKVELKSDCTSATNIPVQQKE